MPVPGERINEVYEVKSILGEGSFGVVYDAEQLPLRRRVAIKMLKPEVLIVPDVVPRFFREAQLTAALGNRHTVIIYDMGGFSSGSGPTLPYLVMEHLTGCSLDAYLTLQGPLSLGEACVLLLQMLESLAEAHSRGIVHRDVKPENMFLCDEGGERVVKLLDFGIAKAIGGDWSPETRVRLTQAGMLYGTPGFMAPEQAIGAEEVTPEADVYGVGCVAFLMLTGQLPYPGASVARLLISHIQEPVPELPMPFTDTPVEKVLRRALAKEPSERFSNAGVLATRLREAMRLTEPALLRRRVTHETLLPPTGASSDSGGAIQASSPQLCAKERHYTPIPTASWPVLTPPPDFEAAGTSGQPQAERKHDTPSLRLILIAILIAVVLIALAVGVVVVLQPK